MDQVNMFTWMEVITKEDGKMTKKMGLEFMNVQANKNIKESGSTEKNMEKDIVALCLEMFTKENLLEI